MATGTFLTPAALGTAASTAQTQTDARTITDVVQTSTAGALAQNKVTQGRRHRGPTHDDAANGRTQHPALLQGHPRMT